MRQKQPDQDHERWVYALDASAIGVWELDLGDHSAWRSRLHDQIFGYPELLPEWTYETFLEHVIEEDRRHVHEEFERALAKKGEWRFECRITRADGEQRWIAARGRVHVDGQGVPAAMFGTVQDITDSKRVEETLRASDRAKEEFLAVLGHELRNPLAPLVSGLDLLEQAPQDGGLRDRSLAMMRRQMTHLVRLVDDLLDVSRISRGHIQLQRRQIDLREPVLLALEQMETLIADRNHDLRLELCDAPLPVDGDLERLTQVVANLLSNAARYTDPGGVLSVATWRTGDAGFVSVRDNGRGIDPEHALRLFELFSRSDTSKRETSGGLGVGLALSRRLMKLHGGSIEVTSDGPGHGSEFVVQLPLSEAVPMASE